MGDAKDDTPGMTEAEKLRTQAETGGGRSMARPAAVGSASDLQPGGTVPSNAPLGAGIGSTGTHGAGSADATSGMSGAPTNDAMPGGGATGVRPLPDAVDPSRS